MLVLQQCTLIYLLDHLAMVVSQCNKMSPASLAVCFGPVLMLHSDENGPHLDFQQPIAVLKYLLEIWPVKSGNVVISNNHPDVLIGPRIFAHLCAIISKKIIELLSKCTNYSGT